MPDQEATKEAFGKDDEKKEQPDRVRAGLPPLTRAAEPAGEAGSSESKDRTDLKPQENLRDGRLKTEKE